MARKIDQVTNRAVAGVVEPMADGLVTVRALAWVCEDGVTYPPAAEFKTTPERAESLVRGKNVEILS